MLLGNYTPLSANPGRCVTHAIPNPYKWRSTGNMYSFYTGDAVVLGETDKSSFNNGYVPPYSWVISPKAGGLSSVNELVGLSEFVSGLSMGKNANADLVGVGDLTSNLSLVVSLLSDLAGSGTLSASMVGSISLAAGLIGQGDVTAGLNLLANCISTMTGSGVLSSDLRGKLSMSADIYVSQAEASVQEMVYAVWNAIASSYNESGTMGNKLNGAGSAGDPWTTDLTTYNTDGTAGKKLKDLKTPSLLAGPVVLSH